MGRKYAKRKRKSKNNTSLCASLLLRRSRSEGVFLVVIVVLVYGLATYLYHFESSLKTSESKAITIEVKRKTPRLRKGKTTTHEPPESNWGNIGAIDPIVKKRMKQLQNLQQEQERNDCLIRPTFNMSKFELSLYGHKIEYMSKSYEVGMNYYQAALWGMYRFKILKAAMRQRQRVEKHPLVLVLGSGIGVFSLFADSLGARVYAISKQLVNCQLHYFSSKHKDMLNVEQIEASNTEDLWGQLYEALFSTILPTISGREVQLLEINLPGLGLKLLENFEIFDDVSVQGILLSLAPPQDWFNEAYDRHTLKQITNYGEKIFEMLTRKLKYEIRLLSSSELYSDLEGESEEPYMVLYKSHNHWKKLFRYMRGKRYRAQLWITRSAAIDELFALEMQPKRQVHGSNHGGTLWRRGDPGLFDAPRTRKQKNIPESP